MVDVGRGVGVVAVLMALGVSGEASALMQPNGKVIPVGPSLQNLFNMRMEGINALSEAAITPQRFRPACEVKFEVLQRNAGYRNSFGWYNVTGVKPTLAELHEILKCSDLVGTKKAVSIKTDPAYLGGDVGFFQAVGGVGPNCADVKQPATVQFVFFSEPALNPDAQQMNPFIHLLIYDSKVTPRTFYFGWEDLIMGGDDDFDDLTTLVSGISCFGDPCMPFVDPNDLDNDGYCEGMGQVTLDNCLDISNPEQIDSDADKFGDLCDNCPIDPNPDQADADNDQIGDLCDGVDTDNNPGSTGGSSSGGTDTGGGSSGTTDGVGTDGNTGGTSGGSGMTSGGSMTSTSGTSGDTSGPVTSGGPGTGEGSGGSGDGGVTTGQVTTGTATGGGGGSDTQGSSGSASDTSGVATDSGCACSSESSGGPLSALLGPLVWLGARRRRR